MKQSKYLKTNKKQLNKWQKALIGISIAIGVILLAFIIFAVVLAVRSHNDYNNNSDAEEETTTSVYEQRIDVENGEDDAVDVDTTPVNIKLSDKGLNKFENYVSSINVDYDYADAYNIDEALKIYNDNTANSVTKHSHDIRVNGEFDADAFYELVKKNNEKFLADAKENYNDGWYKEYSNKELKQICTDMMEALPAIAEEDPTVDVDRVSCYLYNLVILGKSGALDFGGFTMDNRFYLNYDNMETGAFAMDTDDINLTTFYHEMMHAYQFACDDIKKSDEDRMGITHTYNELEINPLSWYWLLEGSAEMNMSQYLDVQYSTYKTMITYIESMNFISNIGSDNLVQTEKLCFQPKLEKLFEQLDATTDEEKQELIKMMYSIEILQEQDDEFYDWYESEYGVDLSIDSNGEETFLCLTLKEDALFTMTKIFYRNLAQQVNTGNATLQDVYYLMRVWEADLDRHFSNNTIGYMEFFHNFYDTYVSLQDEFLQLIAQENGLNFDTVVDDFENYSMNTKTKSPNCDLVFLNSDSKNYITTTFVDSFYKKGYPSIRSCQKQTVELDKKYPIEDMIVNKVLAY
jgi:archaellum component FlaF (FlaF/FlaG flagellin family)